MCIYIVTPAILLTMNQENLTFCSLLNSGHYFILILIKNLIKIIKKNKKLVILV